MQVLERSIEHQEDDGLLKALIELGDHCPKYLRSQLEHVIELMLKVSLSFCSTNIVEANGKQCLALSTYMYMYN